MRAFAGVALLLLLLFLPALPATAQDSRYADMLVAQARQKRLAEHAQWLTLVHYLPGLFGNGRKGVIDSPGFYLAAGGKTDPRAELEATIRAFFRPPPKDDEKRQAQCAFVARYNWLKAELEFDSTRLPKQPCPDFEKWYAAIDPAQVTLGIPAASLNQPTSMFGHT